MGHDKKGNQGNSPRNNYETSKKEKKMENIEQQNKGNDNRSLIHSEIMEFRNTTVDFKNINENHNVEVIRKINEFVNIILYNTRREGQKKITV